MSHSTDTLHRSSFSNLGINSPLPEVRASTKRPRERSTSPRFDDASSGMGNNGLESDEGLLSFSDLIRPLSATPSPEPSLHFGTPPRMFRINEAGASASSDYDSSIPQYVPRSDNHEEDVDDVVDDSEVAEMRRTVVAWGLTSKASSTAGSEQSKSGRDRQLAMMVMALTHPTRPTASQIAAQAEHIRALLAERSVIMQQLEDLSEFRHADRLGFERTAQALNARVVRGTKLNGSPLTARETVYQDERTRNAELHAQNERLNLENSRLERELKDAKRETNALKQSIESLRVNLLVRPRTPSSTGSQATIHSVVNPPTPNPRGRPRKYPLSSPTHTSVFQAPTHSNPGAQLPVSSSSILNTSASLPTSTQPPPEKRLRATQPDARAELLLAAARRVGKDRVVEVLEGPAIKRLTDTIAKDNTESGLEGDGASQPRAAPARHESPPATRADRRGRPSRTSISLPSTAHHHFNQFLIEETGRPDSGRGRGIKMRPTKSAQEMSRHAAAEPMKGGGVFDARPSVQSHAPRQPQMQTQQVVVAFTGNPQADAQACLASFLAQYPGIQPVPMWGAGRGDDAPGVGGESEMAAEDQAVTANGTPAGTAAGAGTIQRVHSTPELGRSGSGSRGLEHLLTAARTVLRARSRSTTPTPRRQLHSASLTSPYRLAQRRHSPISPKSRQATSTRRRHSSPVVQPGDSDTEPEETPKSRRRVYSALDVLADQAAAVRTSSPDPPVDVSTPSPDLFGRIAEPSASMPDSSTPLTALPPTTSVSLPESSTSLDVTDSDKKLLTGLSPSPSPLNRPRVPSVGPFGGGQLATPGAATDTEAETLDQAGSSTRQHSHTSTGELGNDLRQQETDTWETESVQPGTHTPPRSDKARGKQRA